MLDDDEHVASVWIERSGEDNGQEPDGNPRQQRNPCGSRQRRDGEVHPPGRSDIDSLGPDDR